ncbi:UrcA family protein [Parasphingopyxis sp.]|uniref:UrcA family protein n=1 Tax=Parasphingopyxis sp. TaxID=1920299 RepID=UPI0026361B66|nr:UrcA family protein [Parasphingopyxis sp.]
MQKIAFAIAAVAMAGAATAFTTSPALAGVGYATESVTIDTRAYNVHSAQGYALLAGQIDRAAEQVCGTVDVRNLAGAETIRACQDDAINDAMAQLINLARQPSVTIGAMR